MISLVSSLPSLSEKSAESVKINCLFEAYKNDDRVLFWVQDEEKAVISLSDSNMIIHNISADMEELKEFVEVINPVCIFSDLETLENLGKTPKEKIYVMARKCDSGASIFNGKVIGSSHIKPLAKINRKIGVFGK